MQKRNLERHLNLENGTKGTRDGDTQQKSQLSPCRIQDPSVKVGIDFKTGLFLA